MSERQTKYTLTDIDGGFQIDRDGGLTLTVTYAETYLQVGKNRVGLYNYQDMMGFIGAYFMEHAITHYVRKASRQQGAQMIARALGGRVKPHWERIIKEIAPLEVSELARLMWSSVYGDCRFIHMPELYTDQFRYIRSDLQKYHACRVYARACQEMVYGVVTGNENVDRLTTLSDWRNQLAPNAPTKALNKTLDHMPRGIALGSITRLGRVDLRRPITNRLHLITVLEGADHHHWNLHQPIFLEATPALIIEAGTVLNYTIGPKSKVRDVSNFARYILDYPLPFHGDIVGLARLCRDWHRRTIVGSTRSGLPDETPLPLLNLNYEHLETLGIVPLRTVGQVIEEGEQMHHCVGGYAVAAAQGRSFLFHVTYNEHEATIELASDGHYRQGYGACNTINPACEYGKVGLEVEVSRVHLDKTISAMLVSTNPNLNPGEIPF